MTTPVCVRIFRPSKTAMQSGKAKTQQWKMEGIPLTRKEPSPLTGWVGAGDTLGQISLTFDTCEQAVAHAQSKGWQYTVLPEHLRQIRPKSYAANFTGKPPQTNS